ncbi:MAG: thioredoxin family protein [Acidimicrobiales bacterium]
MLVITTPWCHHCRAMQPELDRLEQVYGTSMQIERIDATLDPDRVGTLSVKATPTVIMRVAGAERARLIGRVSARDLEQFFASTGSHRPFPLDGITRAAAGVALMGIGWWLATPPLAAIGAALVVWAAVTMWRWSR